MPSARSERTPGWRVFAGITTGIASTFIRLDLRDAHKLPKTGAFILTPNHLSDIDPVAMGYAVWKMGRVPRFLAKASLFQVPVVGLAMRRMGQIPVERSMRGGANPLLAAARLAVEGHAVIIYPEGTLTRDPDLWPMRGKTGAARAALEHDLPVIPAAQWGAQQVLPRWGRGIRFFPRHTVHVIVGDPVDLSAWRGSALDTATLTAATAAIMADITHLEEQLRGTTAPLERWDPAQHGQSEYGRP